MNVCLASWELISYCGNRIKFSLTSASLQPGLRSILISMRFRLAAILYFANLPYYIELHNSTILHNIEFFAL